MKKGCCNNVMLQKRGRKEQGWRGGGVGRREAEKNKGEEHIKSGNGRGVKWGTYLSCAWGERAILVWYFMRS